MHHIPPYLSLPILLQFLKIEVARADIYRFIASSAFCRSFQQTWIRNYPPGPKTSHQVERSSSCADLAREAYTFRDLFTFPPKNRPMAMAALRHGARRLACQRPPAIFRAAASEEQRRLIHVGPPALGRTFSLAEEQRRLSTRLIHGGRPAGGKTYARPFRSNHVSDALIKRQFFLVFLSI
jgi:hypothetical protein